MNTQDAIELLGIVPEDDEREIKRKYHKMISRFHPDSLNEVGEAHIQRAQEINEAYRILSQSDSREMQNVYGTEVYGTEAHTIINLGRGNSIRNGLVNGTRLLLYQGIFICTIV